MTSIARQVGNAVPPLLARRIADSLASALDERGSATLDRADLARAA
jgi:site-specific DNA-cytosine methylase